MRTTDVVEKLTDALTPEAEARGLELVAVEQAGGRGMPVLRVLLDREGGIDIDAVAAANEWVAAVVDAVEPYSHPYTLEVSSPGIDRPLTKRDDFVRFQGETATIKTAGTDGRRTWTGTLAGVQDDQLILSADGSEVHIRFDTIQKARLKGTVDFGKGRGQQ
jgi:ribosome maturation factor RimP